MKRREFMSIAVMSTATMGAGLGGAPWKYAASNFVQATPDGRPHCFKMDSRGFLLDGKPFHIRSGEMHPARIPRGHWQHRIRMAKAMGLNTIAIYIMWNHLEQEPGVFDFSQGNRNVFAFIQLCQQESMWVYLRPGPYICGEWDLGGLPAYLLRQPHIQLRDQHDPIYMAAVDRYISTIAPQIRALMAAAGGPILMLQIENEYSSYAADVGYLETLRTRWRTQGIEGPFSVSDVLPDLKRRHANLPGAALGIDGAGLEELWQGKALANDVPVWVGEAYPGWLSYWGDLQFAHKDYSATLRQIMAAGYSFNLYVVHGGSNFGLGAGANADDDGSNFQPVITSYDYSAPINERGDPTPAYAVLREIITAASGNRPPACPMACPRGSFAETLPRRYASLWDNLPEHPVRVRQPLSNEQLLQQNQGLVLYRARTRPGRQLHLAEVHDYASIHVNQIEHAHLSRVRDRHLNSHPYIDLPDHGTSSEIDLDILVDSFGHIHFGPQLGQERKGLTGAVRIDGNEVHDWTVYGWPLDVNFIEQLIPIVHRPKRPGQIFRAELELTAEGDVYIDMSGWTKGYVWINSHLLGRYWHIGPQQSLYCPAEWLERGRNQLFILDLHQLDAAPVRCADGLLAAA